MLPPSFKHRSGKAVLKGGWPLVEALNEDGSVKALGMPSNPEVSTLKEIGKRDWYLAKPYLLLT